MSAVVVDQTVALQVNQYQTGNIKVLSSINNSDIQCKTTNIQYIFML